MSRWARVVDPTCNSSQHTAVACSATTAVWGAVKLENVAKQQLLRLLAAPVSWRSLSGATSCTPLQQPLLLLSSANRSESEQTARMVTVGGADARRCLPGSHLGALTLLRGSETATSQSCDDLEALLQGVGGVAQAAAELGASGRASALSFESLVWTMPLEAHEPIL